MTTRKQGKRRPASLEKVEKRLKEEGQEAYVNDLMKIGLNYESAMRVAYDHVVYARRTRKQKALCKNNVKAFARGLRMYGSGDESVVQEFIEKQQRLSDTEKKVRKAALGKALDGKKARANSRAKEVLRLYETGATYLDIAENLRITVTTVYRHIAAHGHGRKKARDRNLCSR